MTNANFKISSPSYHQQLHEAQKHCPRPNRKGEVNLEHCPRNKDLKFYKDPIHNHFRGNDKGKGKDYHKTNFTYDELIGNISQAYHTINVVTILGKDLECNVTTQRGRIIIQGAPPQEKATSKPSNDYNIVE